MPVIIKAKKYSTFYGFLFFLFMKLIIYFRFLESLQNGCLPVVLSNNWEMPFADFIDWQKCALLFDERNINGVSNLNFIDIISTDSFLFRYLTRLNQFLL